MVSRKSNENVIADYRLLHLQLLYLFVYKLNVYKSNPIFEAKIDTFIKNTVGFFSCFHGLNRKNINKSTY